jgi:hypothetical protein
LWYGEVALPSRRISVTVDNDVLREIRQYAGRGVDLSSIVNEYLRRQVQRLRMQAILDEMDARKPISKKGQTEGERLWQCAAKRSIAKRVRRAPVKRKR